MSFFLALLSFLVSLFICSFSSIFGAIVLMFSTVCMMSLMYWNMIPTIPIYMFSLLLLGGLYVLIGFMMMADLRDLDKLLEVNKFSEFIWFFATVFFSLILTNTMKNSFNLFIEFSPLSCKEWIFSEPTSSTFMFLIIFMFIYLFVLHVMMKSSGSSMGFLN